MAKQLLGKEVTAALNEKIKANVATLQEKGVTPTLGIIRVGENGSDISYEKVQQNAARHWGLHVKSFCFLPMYLRKSFWQLLIR